MHLFRFAPALRRNPEPDALIRIFQSEVSEVREDPEPAQLRITLHVLAGLLIALLSVSFFMQLNRVVTSSAGQIVTTGSYVGAVDVPLATPLTLTFGELGKLDVTLIPVG